MGDGDHMLRTVVLPALTPIYRAALSAVMRSAAGRVVGADVEGSVQGGVRRVATGDHPLCGVAGSAHAAARALAQVAAEPLLSHDTETKVRVTPRPQRHRRRPDL